MGRHLSDEKLIEAMMGEGDITLRDHLRQCSACRQEKEMFQNAVGEFRNSVRAESERPETYWINQHNRICTALQSGTASRTGRLFWVLASTAAVVAFAAALGIVRRPAPPVSAMDPDHQLLLDVERSLRRDLPVALEPAELLIQELRVAATVSYEEKEGERQ